MRFEVWGGADLLDETCPGPPLGALLERVGGPLAVGLHLFGVWGVGFGLGFRV